MSDNPYADIPATHLLQMLKHNMSRLEATASAEFLEYVQPDLADAALSIIPVTELAEEELAELGKARPQTMFLPAPEAAA